MSHGVLLLDCLLSPLLRIARARSQHLEHTETVLSSSINHTMMMMKMMKSVSRCPSARLRAVSSAPHRSRSIPAPGTYRNSVEQLDQSHDDDDDDDDEERLTASFCSTACCLLCSASLALDPSTWNEASVTHRSHRTRTRLWNRIRYRPAGASGSQSGPPGFQDPV